MEQVEVEITGMVITQRYGTLNTGDILRTDAAFAKHLVEEANGAKYTQAKKATPLTVMLKAASVRRQAPKTAPKPAEDAAPYPEIANAEVSAGEASTADGQKAEPAAADAAAEKTTEAEGE
ncbi:putative membrane protein [Polaromonas sp. CG_9.5]|uniref:hypothetical protein n=1 Tax=Polaromonas sp. CG_9.5 TaxID=3071705 RepID=UPI002E0342EB|nr:putative membrane protein [Polaromonas sp. CG_9.5]